MIFSKSKKESSKAYTDALDAGSTTGATMKNDSDGKNDGRNRLFHVTVEYSAVVLAKTQKEAEDIALDIDDVNLSDEDIEVTVCNQVKTIKDLPEEWKKCYPFGDDSISMTCEQHLFYMIETDREEERQRVAKEAMDRRQLKFDLPGIV